jgi:hypothetical protein
MIHRSVFLVVAILAMSRGASAQSANPMVFPADPIALLYGLLGTNCAFSASAEVSGEGPTDPDNFHMDVSYAMLRDFMRTGTDLAKLRSRNACDIAQGRLQEMGMDDTILIKLPDLKTSYVVYPRAHAYIEMPLDWRERLKTIVDLQKAPIGTGTVDGHPCRTYRVHVTNALGDENDVVVWEATDLSNFPVQLRFEIAPSTFNILFHDVRLEAPDIGLFQPPADFDRYGSLRELVRARRTASEPTE